MIGLSQLVKKEIIDAAKIGVVGFHPTALPKMRGRAANVWQVLLGVHDAACSLFFIDEGMDSGDILGQEPYTIEDTDYAMDVRSKIDEAAARLSRRVLKEIMDGTLRPKKQNEAEERRRQRRAESVENRIHEIETELADIQDEMSLPENASDPGWMHEKASRMAALEEEVTGLYDEWMELQ